MHAFSLAVDDRRSGFQHSSTHMIIRHFIFFSMTVIIVTRIVQINYNNFAICDRITIMWSALPCTLSHFVSILAVFLFILYHAVPNIILVVHRYVWSTFLKIIRWQTEYMPFTGGRRKNQVVDASISGHPLKKIA